MSLSELEITFTFIGLNKVAKGEIIRYQAPLTVQKLYDMSPTVRCRMNLGSTQTHLMLLLDIKKGIEKEAAKEIKVGDIIYDPKQDALHLIFAPVKFPNPVKYIGHITEGLNILQSIPNGTNVKISFIAKKT
jgi:hypothetical protein